MRYIGGKRLFLDKIFSIIEENTKDTTSFADIFSGSGVVGDFFKKKGYKIISNDFLYFSYAIQAGSLLINKKPTFTALRKNGIKDPINYLNNAIDFVNIEEDKLFIFNNYSPNNNCDRMYLSSDNAKRIDYARITIENWKDSDLLNNQEYYYLLGCIIAGVPFVSNITGTYGAYLKTWDKRALKRYTLVEPEITNNKQRNTTYNEDVNKLIKTIKGDILYLDPPYNNRQYLPNYHVLETIAKYDYPAISGITGMRAYQDSKSTYCSPLSVLDSFDDLIKKAKFKYILVSYNNEGLMTSEQITSVMKKYGKASTFKLFEYPYRRFKSNANTDLTNLNEQIYYIEKEG